MYAAYDAINVAASKVCGVKYSASPYLRLLGLPVLSRHETPLSLRCVIDDPHPHLGYITVLLLSESLCGFRENMHEQSNSCPVKSL